MKRYDVIILGGGIVGLTSASAFMHHGIKRIALVEGKQLKPDDLNQPDQRVSTINPGSQKIFTRLHVWEAMQHVRVSPFHQISLWDQSGHGAIQFNADPNKRLGTVIEHHVMQQTLFDSIQSSIDCFIPLMAKKIEIKETHALVTLSNHERLQAPLIVGADGANSWLRQQTGIPYHENNYGQHALVTTVTTEKPHQHTAWQCFLEQGPLALLPLLDPHQCSIVWSTSSEQAQQLKTCEQTNFNQTITPIFYKSLGNIQVLKPRITFPLIKRQIPQPFQTRIVLIGDAAHTIHPLAGQGVNLGIGDAATLANIIKKAYDKQRDIGAIDTLQRYARHRKETIKTWLIAMDCFHQLFTQTHPAIITARSLGLNLTNQLPCLKKQLVTYAS